MKIKILACLYCTLAILAVLGFNPFAKDGITHTQLAQNPQKTSEKYKDIWADRTIEKKLKLACSYQSGDCVGTITIPKMDYYEMPIYYGADDVNNNWQITTLGHLGNWDMFGEDGRAAVGAHNYQLFANLEVLEPGDLFLIESNDEIFIYEVVGNHVYNHLVDDWYQVAYKDALPYSVSLMTCWPMTQGAESTGDTYIVYSRMVKGVQYKSE